MVKTARKPKNFEQLKWLNDFGKRNGYLHLVLINDSEYVAINRLIFHYSMIKGTVYDEEGYDDRWCYGPDFLETIAHLTEWQGRNFKDEPLGWNRHPATGRRRPDGNPEKEYIQH